MRFLIEYNRQQERIVTFRTFDDTQLHEAEALRREIELNVHRDGSEHEVVLLDSEDERTVRRTHRRYFEGIREILEAGTERDE